MLNKISNKNIYKIEIYFTPTVQLILKQNYMGLLCRKVAPRKWCRHPVSGYGKGRYYRSSHGAVSVRRGGGSFLLGTVYYRSYIARAFYEETPIQTIPGSPINNGLFSGKEVLERAHLNCCCWGRCNCRDADISFDRSYSRKNSL